MGRGLRKTCLGLGGSAAQGGAGGGLRGSPGSVPRDWGWGGGGMGARLLQPLHREPGPEVGRLGGGPRLTQQCLGAGWESLILPGNDGGPCPCVSDIYRLRPPGPLPQAAVTLPNLPAHRGSPFILSEGCCRRGGSRLAGCPLKGHNGPKPLPHPGVICHPVGPEPTANRELGSGSHTLRRPRLAGGQGPGSSWSAPAWSCASAGSGSIFQCSVGWSNREAPNTVW